MWGGLAARVPAVVKGTVEVYMNRVQVNWDSEGSPEEEAEVEEYIKV